MSDAQRRKLGHEVEDFVAAAIYPGGTNIVKGARWGLWDYGGKMAPESQCALILDLEPTDNSNGGKPHTEYWNVGEAKTYGPVEEGRFIEGVHEMSQSCNAFMFMKSLQDSCGMERGRLSADNVGVFALIGSEITFIRVPDSRDKSGLNTGLDPTTGQPRQAAKPKDVLVASKAHFPWEGTRKGTAAKPAATKPATATTTATAAKASTNGNGDSGDALTTAIISVLTENDGAYELSGLIPKITEKLTVAAGVSAGRRITMIKSIKSDDGKEVDPSKLASLSDQWTVDDGMVALN